MITSYHIYIRHVQVYCTVSTELSGLLVRAPRSGDSTLKPARNTATTANVGLANAYPSV